METVTGLIPNDEHLQHLQESLNAAGVADERIDVLEQPARIWQRLGGHKKAQVVKRKAALGVLVGIAVGAVYGVLPGYLLCRYMDCPLQLSFTLWAAVTVFWMGACGLTGALLGLESLEKELYDYMQGPLRGETLVLVDTPVEKADKVIQLLRADHGSAIHEIQPEQAV